MKIYVDIDNTICTTPCLDGENIYSLSMPIEENIKKINKLHDEGNYIVYWTARGATSGVDYTFLTLKQLKQWGAKYDKLDIGNKPRFDLLIDDKAINIDAI
ncbi:MAG TPA: hypothetical protein PKV73_01225 [Agriterribacter sp.]|nr:hypothetical protein [Agriterribacter sp.]